MDIETVQRILERPGVSLIVGPPMSAYREQLYGLVTSVVQGGTPCILVLTDEGSPEARNRLTTRGLDVEHLESEGLLWYVDAFSPSVGWAHTAPNTEFVEDPGVDGILLAVSELEGHLLERFPGHVIIVDSLSSILVLHDTGEAFQLVRGLRGLSARLGATVIGALTSGMHDEKEVVPLAHLAAHIVNMDETGNTRVRSQPKPEHIVKGWG